MIPISPLGSETETDVLTGQREIAAIGIMSTN
jgi:hypothetical protein